MIIIKSKAGVPVRLTQERWEHIIERHPEMENQKEKVLETLDSPDAVYQGDLGTMMAQKFYPVTPLTMKYLTVIYKEISEADGFVLTAYFARQASERRKVIWKP